MSKQKMAKWKEKFSRSSIGSDVFYIKNSKKYNAGLDGYGASYVTDPFYDQLLEIARSINCLEKSTSSYNPGSSVASHTNVYAFLDGGIISAGGNYFPGPIGAWVCGKKALGFLCDRAGLLPPARKIYTSFAEEIENKSYWPDSFEIIKDRFSNTDLTYFFKGMDNENQSYSSSEKYTSTHLSRSNKISTEQPEQVYQFRPNGRHKTKNDNVPSNIELELITTDKRKIRIRKHDNYYELIIAQPYFSGRTVKYKTASELASLIADKVTNTDLRESFRDEKWNALLTEILKKNNN